MNQTTLTNLNSLSIKSENINSENINVNKVDSPVLENLKVNNFVAPNVCDIVAPAWFTVTKKADDNGYIELDKNEFTLNSQISNIYYDNKHLIPDIDYIFETGETIINEYTGIDTLQHNNVLIKTGIKGNVVILTDDEYSVNGSIVSIYINNVKTEEYSILNNTINFVNPLSITDEIKIEISDLYIDLNNDIIEVYTILMNDTPLTNTYYSLNNNIIKFNTNITTDDVFKVTFKLFKPLIHIVNNVSTNHIYSNMTESENDLIKLNHDKLFTFDVVDEEFKTIDISDKFTDYNCNILYLEKINKDKVRSKLKYSFNKDTKIITILDETPVLVGDRVLLTISYNIIILEKEKFNSLSTLNSISVNNKVLPKSDYKLSNNKYGDTIISFTKYNINTNNVFNVNVTKPNYYTIRIIQNINKFINKPTINGITLVDNITINGKNIGTPNGIALLNSAGEYDVSKISKANVSNYGVTRYATLDEVKDGVLNDVAVSPRTITETITDFIKENVKLDDFVYATTYSNGIVRLSTEDEVLKGKSIDTSLPSVVTVDNLKNANVKSAILDGDGRDIVKSYVKQTTFVNAINDIEDRKMDKNDIITDYVSKLEFNIEIQNRESGDILLKNRIDSIDKQATSTEKGLSKLYDNLDEYNTDGSVTQNAIKSILENGYYKKTDTVENSDKLNINNSTNDKLYILGSSTTDDVYGNDIKYKSNIYVTADGVLNANKFNGIALKSIKLENIENNNDFNIILNNNSVINFGGNDKSDSIYFGLKANEQKPKPVNYYFGNENDNTTKIYASSFITPNSTGELKGKSTSSYHSDTTDNLNGFICRNNNDTVNCDTITSNSISCYSLNGPTTGATSKVGALYCQYYNSTKMCEIAQDYVNGNLFVRGKNDNKWSEWNKIALEKNHLNINGGTLNGKLTINSDLTVTGDIEGNRVYNTANNDYAECFDNSNLNYKLSLHRIVQINDDEKVELATYNSKRVIGIISDNYGHLLGGSEQEIQSSKKIPVGLAGTLYVDTKDKLDRKNIGEFIISKNDGYATVVENRNNFNVVGKIIGFDFTNNRYKVLLVLR